MRKININKINLYVKQDKMKHLEELGFYKETDISLAGTPLSYYRFDLEYPTYICVMENGRLDICSEDYLDGDDDVFGIANIIYKLTKLDLLENRYKEEII